MLAEIYTETFAEYFPACYWLLLFALKSGSAVSLMRRALKILNRFMVITEKIGMMTLYSRYFENL